MRNTTDGLTEAIKLLRKAKAKTKPRPRSIQTKDAIEAAGIEPELREHRRALVGRVGDASARFKARTKELTELLQARGHDNYVADRHRAAGPEGGTPRRWPWIWYRGWHENDEALARTRGYLTTAEANLRATSLALQLFDACHGVTGIEYAELPAPLDQVAIERAAYDGAADEYDERMAAVKAMVNRHRDDRQDFPPLNQTPDFP